MNNDWLDYLAYRNQQNFLAHYGVGHDKGGHSGRFKWGSGKKWQTTEKKRSEMTTEERKKKYTDYGLKKLVGQSRSLKLSMPL